MPSWLRRVLTRVRSLAVDGKVAFTGKALDELQALRLDEHDAVEVLSTLSAADAAGRVRSQHTAEWLYVFKPRIEGSVLYVKVAVRSVCIVVSFHEESTEENGA